MLKATAVRLRITRWTWCRSRVGHGCGWRTSPTSIGNARWPGVDPRFLRADYPKGGPVKLALTPRDTRDQPVPDDAHRWHRDARFLCLRERQAHILKHEGQDKSGPVR